MSTSETPPLFPLPPCFLSLSSSLSLAKAAPGTAIRAPPASAAADPVRKRRREVSDLPSFSSRYVRSLMYSLSFSRVWPEFWPNLFIAADRSTCPVTPFRFLRSTPGAQAARGGVITQRFNTVYERGGDSDHSAPSPASIFFTCFYAILDPEPGRLNYTKAGHLLPYLCRSGEAQE